MRWIIGLAVLGLLTVPALATGEQASILEKIEADYVPPSNHWIVGFYTTPTQQVGDLYLGNRIVAVDTDLNFVVVEVANLALFEEQTRSDESVRYVEWDNPMMGQLFYVPNDTRYNDAGHYGSKIIKSEQAWDRTRGSTSVKLAVIDSGLKKTHEDITGSRVLTGYDFVNNDNDPQDTSGCSYHGTHVTGTAAATINNAKGIAGMSQSTILPVRTFYSSGFGCSSSTTILVNSLKYAGDQGAHVSTNSWGSSASSTATNDAVQYSHDRGVIHSAAAGNSGSCTNCVSYPWKDKGSITIVSSCSAANDAWCSFSSQGPQVDVAAPGNAILSADGAGTTGYKTMSGTSMSTPHTSGVACLIKALNPSFTFSQVESRIKSTADNLGWIADRQGAGRLDAGGAVY